LLLRRTRFSRRFTGIPGLPPRFLAARRLTRLAQALRRFAGPVGEPLAIIPRALFRLPRVPIALLSLGLLARRRRLSALLPQFLRPLIDARRPIGRSALTRVGLLGRTLRRGAGRRIRCRITRPSLRVARLDGPGQLVEPLRQPLALFRGQPVRVVQQLPSRVAGPLQITRLERFAERLERAVRLARRVPVPRRRVGELVSQRAVSNLVKVSPTLELLRRSIQRRGGRGRRIFGLDPTLSQRPLELFERRELVRRCFAG